MTKYRLFSLASTILLIWGGIAIARAGDGFNGACEVTTSPWIWAFFALATFIASGILAAERDAHKP